MFINRFCLVCDLCRHKTSNWLNRLSFDPPEATSPTPRKKLPFWIRRSRVFTADILQEVITQG
uniref:Uncharacterized protein n=1 Tax=Hyaloperonospora arabidopsidis (strain Emoy2) TaxID=559515 RepID=M4BGS4_HYAAE